MEPGKHPREEFHKDWCLSFVTKLWEADTLAMFHHPVSAEDVPHYYEVIETPIDLSEIRKKVEEGKYRTDSEVEDDVALMLANALEFNERGSEWYDLAKNLKKVYPSLAKQAGLSFDEGGVFIPTKKTRDDETTLRKEEKHSDEKMEEVLDVMQKEREIPLEELRAMYKRPAQSASASNASSEGDGGSESSLSDSDGDEDDSDDDEESDEESSMSSSDDE